MSISSKQTPIIELQNVNLKEERMNRTENNQQSLVIM